MAKSKHDTSDYTRRKNEVLAEIEALANRPIDRGELQHVIGIDPGQQTGFADYDVSAGNLCIVETWRFWVAYEMAVNFYDRSRTLAIVEDASLISPTFHHSAFTEAAKAKTSQRVGQVKRESQLLIEGLRRAGFVVQGVKAQGKVNAAQFQKLTGWQGRTSSHARDAAMLAFGVINWPAFEMLEVR